MRRVKIEIGGMTCINCEKHVEKELKILGGKDIKINHKEGIAILTVLDNINEDILKRAVKTAGYEPGRIFFKEIERKGFLDRLLK